MQITENASSSIAKPWYKSVPDPMVLIFIILVATYLLTFIVPSGEFERVVIDGKTTVIPSSFRYLSNTPSLHFFDIFVSIICHYGKCSSGSDQLICTLWLWSSNDNHADTILVWKHQ